jgi:hypothetical protein
MANSLRASTFFALLTIHALSSCATSSVGGPSPNCPPPPLSGAALEFVRAEIAKFDGPDGPDKLFVTGGYGHAADGRKIAYDRWLNVGSLLLGDRGRAFDAFVEGIAQRGGSYFPLYMRSDNKPGKILVVADGKRVMVSVQEW